jgi:hypothetical protein
MGEGREGRRSILLPARRRLTRRVSHLISLVLIVVTVETQQLPVAPVERIVVVVVVLVMDRELAQFLPVKFASAVRTDPRKHLERVLSIGLLQLSLGAPCHASLGEDGDSMGVYQMGGFVVFLSFFEPNTLNAPKKPDQQDLPPRAAKRSRYLFISTGPSRGARSRNDPRGVPEARDSTSRLGSRFVTK